MRYIIYGAGAVGGVTGAKLHLAGHEVVLIGRGEHLRTIQRDGLKLRVPGETMTLPLPAVAHPSEIDFRPDDVVLLCVKSQDTAAALDDLRLVNEDVPIICCQNGVENERAALRRFPRVYGAMVFLPATYVEAGTVEIGPWPRSGVIDIGCFPSGTDALSEDICGQLDNAGFGSQALPNIMAWKYGKLSHNMMNSVQAVVGARPGADDLLKILREEAEAVYNAAGIEFAPLADVYARNQSVRSAPATPPAPGERPAFRGGSTWQSLTRGTGSTEVDYINGEICMLGRTYGVPTPANEAFQIAAERLARTHAEPASISVEDMVADIERRRAAAAATV